MKNYLRFLLMLLLFAPFAMQAQFTATFGTGTSSTSSGGQAGSPMSGGTVFSYTQNIYTAAELTAAGVPAGATIIAIEFSNGTGESLVLHNCRTYMTHRSTTNFTSATDYTPYNQLTLVDSSDWVTTGSGWFTVNLHSPFVWNGTGNLLIAVSYGGASLGGSNIGYNYTTQTESRHWRRGCRLNNGPVDAVYASYPEYTSTSTPSGTAFTTLPATSTNRPNLRITYILSGCASLTPTVANIGPYTADLNWMNFQQAVSSWDILYGVQGTFDTLSGGNTITGITDTFYTLSGLTTTTTYAVYMKPYCSSEIGAWSSPRVFTTTAACPTPTNLTVMSHTAEQAVISWMPGATETGWEVACVPHGSPVGSVTPDYVTSSPYTILNLIDNTQYDVYVRADCGNGEYSYWTSAVTFTTDPYCTPPTNVSVDQIMATSALVTWSYALVGATGYTVGYTEHGTNNWLTQSVTGNSCMLSGLTPNTAYDVIVYSECTQGNVDTVHTAFTTGCLSGGDPFTEGTTTSYLLPLNNYYNYTYTQQIYLASEMGGPATIDSIAFYYSYATPSSVKSSVNIYLGHTSQSTFSGTSNYIPSTGLQQVYTGHLNCHQGWNTFVFTTPFQYNGTDNLVLVVDDNSGDYDGSSYVFRVHNAGATRSLYFYSDSYNPDPANPTSAGASSATTTNRSDVKFFIPCDNTVTCVAPNVYVSDMTHETITVAWAPGNTETSWEMETSTDNTNWVPEGTVTTSPYTLSNLAPNTLYYIRLRSVCGGGDYSNWAMVSVRTACADMTTLPYIDNLESYTGTTSTSVATNNLPNCWSYINDGTSTSYSGYPIIYNSSSSAASGTNAIRFYTYITAGTYDDQIAILPPIDVNTIPMNTLQISLDARAMNTSYTFKLDVGIMTDPTDRNTFVTMQTLNLTSTTYANYEIPFSQYSGTGKYIALRASQPTTGYNYGYVDNIRVEPIPACPKPTNVTSSNVTTNSVTLNWTEVGTATSWEVVYGPAGFTPGSTSGTTETVYTLPHTVTGLSASTLYDFYVSSDCGGTYSNYSNVHTVATQCDYVSVLPFMENFDAYSGATTTSVSASNLPNCWSHYNVGTSTSYSGYPIIYNSSSYAASGTNAMRFYSYSTAGTYSDQIAILPPIDVNTFPMNTLQISFDARQNSTSYSFNLVVGVMSDPTNASTFVPVQTISVPGTTYTNYLVPLTQYTGNGSYIAIKGPQPTSSYNQGYVDNIIVDLAPLCERPSNVMASNITATTADINWMPGGNETGWEVVVVPTGMNILTGTPEPVSTHPYTLTNLTPNTAYDVYVHADCGTGVDFSSWSPVCTFSTTALCNPPTDVTVSQITGSSALLTWTPAVFGATDYTVSYTEAGQQNWITQTVTGNSYMISGLTPLTPYTVTILSNCTEGTAPTVTKNFTTGCLAGGDNIVGNGTSTSYNIPLNTFYNYSYVQQLYLANEINNSGDIHSIGFQYIYSTAQTKTNQYIYLAETNLNSLSTWIPADSLTLVYSGTVSYNNSGTDHWVTITLDSAFNYSGTRNLVVVVRNDDGDYTTSSNNTFQTHSASNMTLQYYDDDDPFSMTSPSSASTYAYRTNIKFGMDCDNTVTCIAPNVYVSAVTENSITLDWAPGNNESSWEMETSTDNINWTPVGTITTAPYMLTNLNASTLYYIRMRSDCGGGEYSNWAVISEHTACALIATLPYMENFDTYAGATTTSVAENNLPYCWNHLNAGTSTSYSGYPIIYNSSSYASSGTNAMRFYTYTTSGTYDDQIAILPEVDVTTLPINTLQLSFDARDNTTSYPFNLEIGVMTDPTNKNTFMLVSTISTQSTTYANYEIPLSQYAGTGAYIAIKAPRPTANYNYGYVDNVKIELIPACPKPTQVHALTTTVNSVNLAWTENGSATSWEIEYGPAGFTLGNGTTVNATTNPYNITGLSASTVYDFYVRADCGGSYSNYSNVYSIATQCDAITQLPYVENFDSYGTGTTVYPLCWGKINTYSSDRPYVNATHYAGVGSLYFYAGTSGTYNIAITPPFDATIPVNTLQANFMYRAQYASDLLIVGVMTSPTDASTFVPVDTVYPTGSATAWAEKEVIFSNYTGTGQYIAFKNAYTTTSAYAYIDNLSIELIPSCPKPQNLTVTGTTTSSVTLTWTETGTATDWNVVYGPVGFDPDTVVTNIDYVSTTPTTTINNLASGTVYEFYVQSDCGSGDESLWRGPVTASPGSINMPATGTTSISACDVVIYDDGGATGDYSTYCNATMTINPDAPMNLVAIQGTLSTESCCDYLRIYDGPNTSGTLLGEFRDENQTIPQLVSTTGPITLYFYSDVSVQKSGFALTVTCIPNTCPRPTNLTVSNVGQTSADLTWTPGGNETAWVVEYKEASASTWTVVNVTTNSYALTGLTTLTAYDVRVKADCGGGDESIYINTTFNTNACAASDQCTYTFVAIDGYGDGWNDGYLTVEQNGVVVATVVAVDHQLSSTTTYDTITVNLCNNISTSLVWHIGDYDDEVTFTLIGPDGTQVYTHTDMDTYTTYTFTTNCNGSGPSVTDPTVSTNAASSIGQTSATLNATITNPDNVTITAKGFEWKATVGGTYAPIAGTGTGNTFTANLTGLTPNTGYTFKAFITYNGTTTYGSEMTFTTEAQQQTCPAPTNVEASNVTMNSADISWTQPDNTANSWDVLYKESAASSWITATTSNNPYTLVGLNAGSSYDVQVIAHCTNGVTSDPSATITFTTQPDGINDYTLDNTVTVYPNPTTGLVQIKNEEWRMENVEVYDVYGKLLNAMSVNDHTANLDLSGYAKGTYFVKVTTERGVVTKRVVKN